MALTDAGRNHIAADVIGESVTEFNNANAHIGVGNSSTAFSASQTDLQGGSKFREAMDATYPQRSTNVITLRSTIATADANFAWNEWGVFNASSSGTMLCRKVEAQGTKPSNESWQITVTLTFHNP
ncbi:MAG TPA: phage tail protein [Nitrososphaera sp.]|nr:phage tail protein [Nitrososphaera sp.]